MPKRVVLPESSVAPLRLTKMTLRAFGSYLHAAELDIRPMTILCGANGSGKSSWIRALRIIKNSLSGAASLPFYYTCDRRYSGWAEYTSAGLAVRDSQGDDEIHGPPGTMGLHFEATRDWSDRMTPEDAGRFGAEARTIDLPQCDGPDAKWLSFLWAGRLPANTPVEIRLTPMPDKPDRALAKGDLPRGAIASGKQTAFGFTLVCDGKWISVRHERGKHQRHVDAKRVSCEYDISASEAFIPGAGVSPRIVPVARIRVDCDRGRIGGSGNALTLTVLSSSIEAGIAGDICFLSISRAMNLLRDLLGGVFSLSAIRDIEVSAHVEGTGREESLAAEEDGDGGDDGRSVGVRGGRTYNVLLERYFAPMRNPETPHTGYINHIGPAYGHETPFVHKGAELLAAASILSLSVPGFSNLAKIAECLTEDLRSEVERAMRAIKSVPQRDDAAKDEWNSLLARVTLALLDSPNLPSEDLLRGAGDEIKFYLGKEADGLDPDEIQRRNRLLLDSVVCRSGQVEGRYDLYDAVSRALPDVGSRSTAQHAGYCLCIFYNLWMRHLVGVSTVFQPGEYYKDPADFWTGDLVLPNGYLLGEYPEDFVDPYAHEPIQGRVNLNILTSDTFPGYDTDEGCIPADLSAGFHQISPIVVQAGVMKKHEIFAIENPEVHLHPRLQVDLMEFLLSQALIGKCILVETHSDLVVSRVIREILEERIAEEDVRIYFTEKERDGDLSVSRLQRLSVNERGEIDNWPEGFMDESLRESRALMRAMYGHMMEEEDDE